MSHQKDEGMVLQVKKHDINYEVNGGAMTEGEGGNEQEPGQGDHKPDRKALVVEFEVPHLG